MQFIEIKLLFPLQSLVVGGKEKSTWKNNKLQPLTLIIAYLHKKRKHAKRAYYL